MANRNRGGCGGCRSRTLIRFTAPRKAGFSPWKGKIERDVDSPLEGDGFELFVPRHESPEFRSIPGIADSSSTGYDREAFRSIHCLPQSLGDDDSDRLAAVAGFSDCQNRVRRDEERGAVVATQRHLVRVRRHGPVRDRLQAVLRRVAADQDRENARRTDRTGATSMLTILACACGERTS